MRLVIGCIAAGFGVMLSTCASAPLEVAPPVETTVDTAAVVATAQPTAQPTASPAPPEPPRPAAITEAMTFDLPEPSLNGRKKLKLWATYYYVPQVSHDPSGHPMRTMDGAELGPKLTRRDWCEAAMQGTVMVALDDGSSTLINYAGIKKKDEVDCRSVYPRHPVISRSRYDIAIGPWGDGVEDMILLPYRTIAVDPGKIPFGSAVYIPAARGIALTLPDGGAATHDGWFFAADRGGAIKKTHIDVFVGVGKHNPFDSFVKSKRKATFEAYVVDGDGAERLRMGHQAPKSPEP